ncbi:MAG: hypothetical protein AUH43_25675 [Acidobacteria bacterium 13_1_40CM_65_14]|nr:MAG: hypothetical protein AUH43_25675 [Acidobacteria bacterium 13_1_40CM_65_14]
MCATGGGAVGGNRGQTEVQNLRLISSRDEDVGGPDVAMDDALRVRRIQTVGDLNGQLQQGVLFERDEMVERGTFEPFHDDERAAVVLVDVVNRANVRVVERRGRSRLAAEAFERVGFRGELVGQQFDGDGARATVSTRAAARRAAVLTLQLK